MKILFDFGITLLAFAILAVPVAGLSWLLWYRGLSGKDMLPPQRERAVPWMGGEVLVALLGTQIWPALALAWMNDTFGIDEADRPFRVALAMVVTYPLHLVFMISLLRLLSGTQLFQVGLHTARWRQGILLGSLSWMAVCVPVYSLQLLVTWLQPEKPAGAHEMVRLMRQDRDPALEWALLLSVAVVLVPVVEEFVFRGLLQRWVGRLAWRGHAIVILALLLALDSKEEVRMPRVLFILVLAPGYHYCPLLFERLFPIRDHGRPRGDLLHSDGGGENNESLRHPAVNAILDRVANAFDLNRQDFRVNQPRAVYATAMLFAVVHSWPDCVPLFLLGLALGWLAYRTQSLVAPIVLHALFNGLACTEIALRLGWQLPL